MPAPTTTVDVLVVGAGPSGLTTAISLARSGVRVLVIEKHTGVSIFPKSTGIRPRSMEIFRSWGLDERIRRNDMALPPRVAVAATLADEAQEVPFGAPEVGMAAEISPADLVVSPQDQLEPILLDHLREVGGQVWFGAEMISYTAGVHSVTTRVRRRDGGELEVRSRYLVGADGPGSPVRELAGIGVESLGSEGQHLAVLFEADLARHVKHQLCVLHLVMRPDVQGMFVPSGEGRWIYDFEWHPELGESARDWPAQRLVGRIQAAAGVPDLEVRLVNTFGWDFGAAVATSHRAGRVFLVGDAAHRTSPRGATGMNTGIADGHNLGWKLAWVVRGWAGEALLDSYDAERGPVGRHNAAASMIMQPGPDAESPLAQDFDVTYRSAVITSSEDLVSNGGLGLGAEAGRRAPHAWVQAGGRRVSTVDLFDGRLTLVTGRQSAAWRRAVTADRPETPLAVITLGVDVLAPTTDLHALFGVSETGAVLVRPDGYIACRWDAAPTDAAGALVGALDQALGWSEVAALESVA